MGNRSQEPKWSGHRYPSVAKAPSRTEKGQAKIPWAVQETKWISIYKDGFSPVENIDVAQEKPIIVRLAKRND